MLTQQGRFRAEWVIVTGFLLVMSGFLAYLNYREYQHIEQREREFLAHQARLLDRNLVPRVRAIDRALLAFRDDLPSRLADAGGLSRANQRMRQTVETLAGVRTMVWMDPAGRVVASSSPDLQGRDLSQQPNFRRIAASPNSHVLYLTPPFKTVLGTYSIALARVVTGRDGAFQGLLMAIVDPEYLRTLLESVIPSADSRSFIVHGNGILLMMSPQLGEDPGGRNLLTGENLFGQFMASSLLETVYSGKSGLFGDERMVAIRRVPHFEMSTDNELMVMVSRGHEAVFANWNSAVRVEAAALAAFACFSIGALLLYQRRMRAAFDAASSEARGRELATDSHKRVTIQMAAAFASMTEAVAVMDTEGTLLAFNEAYARFHRYRNMQECQTTLETGRMLVEVLNMAGDVLPLESRPVTRALAGESATGVACRLMRKDTGEAWIGSFSFAPVRDEQGVIVGAVMACRDITQQLQAEATLVQALKDKDALLKEVHHRVKNNLQIVASLLRLERHRSTHPATQETLVTMLGRIRSMALLHGTLHRSGTLGSLDLAAYLTEVTGQAFKVHQVDATGVALTLDMVPVEAGMDQATPCGLLVNELISNALKHAFAPGQSGIICVRLYPDTEEGFWRLSVSDNGVGLPAGYKETRKASLGLQLASELAMQMGGHMETSSLPAQGARFEVRFRLTRPVALEMPAL